MIDAKYIVESLIEVSDGNDGTLIVHTPYMYIDGGRVCISIKNEGEKYRLTDCAVTLNNLYDQGLDFSEERVKEVYLEYNDIETAIIVDNVIIINDVEEKNIAVMICLLAKLAVSINDKLSV